MLGGERGSSEGYLDRQQGGILEWPSHHPQNSVQTFTQNNGTQDTNLYWILFRLKKLSKLKTDETLDCIWNWSKVSQLFNLESVP